MFDSVLNTIPDQVLFEVRNSIIGNEEEYTQNISRYIPELERVKKEVRFGNFLDIGCGRGEMLQIFKKILPRRENFGTDEIRLCLDICKKKRLPTMWMSAVERLSYIKSGYKAITCIQQLQYMHIGFIFTLFKLARLRLRRGGIIIIQIPNYNNYNEVQKWHNDPRFINAYSYQLIEYLLRFNGFASVEVEVHEDQKNVTIIGTRKPYPQPV